MNKMSIYTKYNLFCKNIMKTITNNNLLLCNMKYYAGFQLFASTCQGKQ